MSYRIFVTSFEWKKAEDLNGSVVSIAGGNDTEIFLNTYNPKDCTSQLAVIDTSFANSSTDTLSSFRGRIETMVAFGTMVHCASSTEGILYSYRNKKLINEFKIKKKVVPILKIKGNRVFLKQAKCVAMLNSELSAFERVWNLERDDVKDFIVLEDLKRLLVLYSNGSCCLVGQRTVSQINYSTPWHSLCHGGDIMLVDAAGKVYYCEYRKGKARISAKACPIPFPVAKVVPLLSGFDCFFSRDGTMLGLLPHISLRDNSDCDIMFDRDHGKCLVAENTRDLVIEKEGTITVEKLDMDRFPALVDSLLQSRYYDTAMDIVKKHKVAALESKVLYSLAHSQIFEEKDYDNGMLNLSVAYGDDTLMLLQFFDAFRKEKEFAEQQQLSNALLPYLWSHRSRVLSSTSSSPELMSLIDTAILNCLLIMPDNTGTVLKFLQRRDVKVDYENSRIALQEKGLYAELLQLYSMQGHHSTAMELIKNLSLNPERLIPKPVGTSAELKGRPGGWAAVRYLSSIANPDISLVKFHCRWMIDLDPDATVTMFQHLYPSIPAKVAVSILSQDGSLLHSAHYLEEILKIKETELGKDSTSVWDDRQALAELYLRMIAQGTTSVLGKFMHVLDRYSHTLDLNKLLRLLPERHHPQKDTILDAKVLVLEKLKQHKHALEILLVDLKDPAKAETYCKRVNDRAVFIDLLKVALASQNSSLRRILEILSRNASPDLVLESIFLVSDTVAIYECYEYITSSIWTLKEHQKKLYMVKHLAKGNLQTVCSKRSEKQTMRYVISSENICSMCQKQLGVAAHVCSETHIYHYSCFLRTKP